MQPENCFDLSDVIAESLCPSVDNKILAYLQTSPFCVGLGEVWKRQQESVLCAEKGRDSATMNPMTYFYHYKGQQTFSAKCQILSYAR
jgi:hypothetical protein